jgi:hypothetical protein
MIDPDRPKPKRLRIIIALQELLSQISIADGDAFDMVGKVYRNRILIGADINTKPPALAIIEAPRPDFAVFAGEENEARKDNWTLLIQGIVADDRTATTADDAYFLCQDVERRLHRMQATKPGSGSPAFPDVYMLDDMITSIEIAPPVIRPPEAVVSSNAFFYLPIRVGIAARIGE